MDLEKLNNDYLRLKVATEKFKTILEQYENDLKLAENNVQKLTDSKVEEIDKILEGKEKDGKRAG